MCVLVVFGTRPEAIKMAPVIHALKNTIGHDNVHVCVTAQHRGMLDQVLEFFDIRPEYDLNLMTHSQDLTDITIKVLSGLRDIFRNHKYRAVLVHGDTTTTMAASIAAFYERIPLGHVEAGLRTHNKYSPWPEEVNRKMTSVVADLHFSPTELSKENLIKEGVSGDAIFITGNTVIDALKYTINKFEEEKELISRLSDEFSYLNVDKKIILVTGHRRENFGEGLESICYAIKEIAINNDVQIVYPVHLNPNVRKTVKELLNGIDNVFLIEPLSYFEFTYLMSKAYFVITDSGGIQEEAPSLNLPILITRNTTERPEVVDSGAALLVGTDRDKITLNATKLLTDRNFYEDMANRVNPYGGGTSSLEISQIIYNKFYC